MWIIRSFGRFIFALVFIIAAAFISFEWYLHHPVMHDTAYVTVESGMSFRGTVRALRKAQVIEYPFFFMLYGELQHASNQLKAGEYEFPPGLTAREVLAKMLRGEVRTFEVRIPEGWNLQQIANYVSARPFITDKEKFVNEFWVACKDPARIAKLGVQTPTLEGFLFPSTYNLQRPKTGGELVDRLVAEFVKQYDQGLRAAATAHNMSMQEVVTLASIIEKETAQQTERPLISAVFHNRLKINMPLATDPTVIYGLAKFDGNLHKSDLENPHPYNTYIHAGLPPGPIANPGRAALDAAINPATTEYMFFVSKNDGTHQFSKTYAEHEAAVNQYQRGH